MIIAYLDISSYRGVSIGARHYYGKIVYLDKNQFLVFHELKRKITDAEVAQMNNEAVANGFLYIKHKKSELTNGFLSREELIKTGIEYFRKNYDGFLIKGSVGSCDPWSFCLSCPNKYASLVHKMNFISIEFQKINGFDSTKDNETLAHTLDKEWGSIFSQIKKLCKSK